MPIYPGEGEFWKSYTGQLKKSMDFIADHGVSAVTRDELKSIGNSIIREAKRRKRALEQAGLTDSPAYRYLVKNEVNLTLAGKNTNTIKHNLREAAEFLQRKTSTVEGAKDFLQTTIDRWVGTETTKEQRERLFDLYNRLEKIHPGYFLKETYGSGELADDIYDIYNIMESAQWDVDEAIRMIEEAEFDPFIEQEIADATARWSGRLK